MPVIPCPQEQVLRYEGATCRPLWYYPLVVCGLNHWLYGGWGYHGGTKLKILTKKKRNREMGDRTDCTVGIKIISIYREVEKTW